MDKIVLFLKDPSWWFSAFFIAIVASVVAGFAKDRLESLIGKLSNRGRLWQERRRGERAQIEDMMADNEGFLVISFVRATSFVLFVILLFSLYLISPMFVQLTAMWCRMVPADPTCGLNSELFAVVIGNFFGLLSVVIGYSSTSNMSLVMRAYKKYRLKRGFLIVRQ